MTADPVERLVLRLREEGARVTTARRLVLTALVRGSRHPSAEDLLAAVRELAPDIHASTVYRNLEELERLGVVVHTHLGHGAATYHLATEVHAHFVCEECGEAIEAPRELLDALVDGARAEVGFVLKPYHFAVLGLCSDCAATADR
jgi:Fur family transcriptional regulator, ferric uptake regulator